MVNECTSYMCVAHRHRSNSQQQLHTNAQRPTCLSFETMQNGDNYVEDVLWCRVKDREQTAARWPPVAHSLVASRWLRAGSGWLLLGRGNYGVGQKCLVTCKVHGEVWRSLKVLEWMWFKAGNRTLASVGFIMQRAPWPLGRSLAGNCSTAWRRPLPTTPMTIVPLPAPPFLTTTAADMTMTSLEHRHLKSKYRFVIRRLKTVTAAKKLGFGDRQTPRKKITDMVSTSESITTLVPGSESSRVLLEFTFLGANLP